MLEKELNRSPANAPIVRLGAWAREHSGPARPLLAALKRGVDGSRSRAASTRQWARERLDERRATTNRRRLGEELSRHAVQLKSHPVSLILEPVAACNLKCPFCPTGGGYGGLPREVLRPETFERIVAHLRLELLEEVMLYNWGEPLLNRHLFDYVRFFSSRAIRTVVSTNFSAAAYDEAFLKRLVDSGLSELIVSVDGASQESYVRYRRGGDLERVLGNMERLNQVKIAGGVAYPMVVYQMLLHRYNASEVEAARELAAERGAEFVLSEDFWCPDEQRQEWIAPSLAEGDPVHAPLYDKSGSSEISSFCRQLWDTAVVGANGDLFPCCLIYQPEHAVANLAESDIDEIRNCSKMVHLRRYVLDSNLEAPDFPNHCEGCASRHCTMGP